jgi:hypothetical protein
MPDIIADLTAAAEAVGPEKLGIIFGIAQIPWTSAAQRDEFLAALTGPSGYLKANLPIQLPSQQGVSGGE